MQDENRLNQSMWLCLDESIPRAGWYPRGIVIQRCKYSLVHLALASLFLQKYLSQHLCWWRVCCSRLGSKWNHQARHLRRHEGWWDSSFSTLRRGRLVMFCKWKILSPLCSHFLLLLRMPFIHGRESMFLLKKCKEPGSHTASTCLYTMAQERLALLFRWVREVIDYHKCCQ